MMLFLAICFSLVAMGSYLAIAFADGMSDAPADKGIGFGFAHLVAVIAVISWACWYFGWHPSW